ncbi:MAG: hypothetical protein QOH65_3244 [Methylobacteriaceae bacterium]|jgi:hypothetical protein|nr:hypothetical protein [Methylobacteriaceae bacterium]
MKRLVIVLVVSAATIGGAHARAVDFTARPDSYAAQATQ